MSTDKITVSEILKRKKDISLIVFDNNVFIVVDKQGKHLTERDGHIAIREFFEEKGFEVIDA